MEEWKKGYVAAMIDGEGTFSIDGLKTCQDRLLGRLRISNTNKALLENLRSIIGKGNVHILKRNTNDPQKNILYEYYLGRRTGLPELLLQINKYLFLKKEHAEIMAKFFSLFGSGKLEEKRRLYLRLKALNRRGR